MTFVGEAGPERLVALYVRKVQKELVRISFVLTRCRS
jgi:hypothetical protein